MSFYDAKQIIWAKLSASELRLVEINIRSYPVDFTAILITSHTVKVTNRRERIWERLRLANALF